MRVFIRSAIAVLALTVSFSSVANGPYRSRELAPPSQEQIMASQLSVVDLEKSMATMADPYSKASTARFLARHYLQEKSYAKAERFYQEALLEQGLSHYALQEVLEELAQVQLMQKNYRGVLQSLAKREQLGGKENSTLLLIQALASYHTQNYNDAVQYADKLQVFDKNLTADSLKQLLFIYFNSKSYKQAASVQQRYLALMPNDMNAWRQLAAIYLKLEDKQKAADTLALAMHNGLALEPRDIVLLAEIYVVNHNPFAAGRLFDEAFERGVLEANADNLDKQFRYWLMARERTRAIKSLQLSLKKQPDIDRYLQLAQLQMDEQQWQAMRDSVLSACAIALPDEYVGRANLLLGISELNLKNPAAARNAFINATLIGGFIDQANAWLRYMDAENILVEEQQEFSGACTPKWARVAKEKLWDSSTEANTEKTIENFQYSIKTIADQKLIVGSYTLAIVEMEKKIPSLAMQLGMAIAKNRGKISGPMHFIFPETPEPDAKVMRIQMAFPVTKEPDMLGRYAVREDSGFKAATVLFTGDPKNALAMWIKLYEQVMKDGHALSGESRQVILEANKKGVKMELQLGIQ